MQTLLEKLKNTEFTTEIAENLDLDSIKVSRLVCKQWTVLFGNHIWKKRLETISNYVPKNHTPSEVCQFIKTLHLYDKKEFQLYPLDYYKRFQDLEFAKCLISTPKLHEKIDELLLVTTIIANPSLLGVIGNYENLSKKICRIFFDIYSDVQILSLQDEMCPKPKLKYIRDYLLLIYQSNDLENIAIKINLYKNAHHVYKTKTHEEIKQRNIKEQLVSAFDLEKAYQIYNEYYNFCGSINNVLDSYRAQSQNVEVLEMDDRYSRSHALGVQP